ncbi:MAG: GvpL/GvpF family gas vesicle protein [Alphaproteobacteria bacterium]
MSGLYLHGIIDAQSVGDLFPNGARGSIRGIVEGEIAAIVSAAPEEGALQNLQREEAMRLLLEHQSMLEPILAKATVLPVKFATTLPDEASVRRMLQFGQAQFTPYLAELSGCLQMDVAVEWPLQDIFVEIASDSAIAELRAKAQAGGGEETQIQLGAAVKDALERRRAALGAQIREKLQAVAREIAVNAPAGDNIVTNLSLLMEQGSLATLDTALEALDAETGGKLTFRCVGPLPMAGFVSVNVTVPPREVVEQAWRLLQLGDEASASDIKASYFRLAQAHHPDTGGTDASSEDMSELAQAYHLLAACAKTSSEALRRDGPSPLAISVMRSNPDISASSSAQQDVAA